MINWCLQSIIGTCVDWHTILMPQLYIHCVREALCGLSKRRWLRIPIVFSVHWVAGGSPSCLSVIQLSRLISWPWNYAWLMIAVWRVHPFQNSKTTNRQIICGFYRDNGGASRIDDETWGSRIRCTTECALQRSCRFWATNQLNVKKGEHQRRGCLTMTELGVIQYLGLRCPSTHILVLPHGTIIRLMGLIGSHKHWCFDLSLFAQ